MRNRPLSDLLPEINRFVRTILTELLVEGDPAKIEIEWRSHDAPGEKIHTCYVTGPTPDAVGQLLGTKGNTARAMSTLVRSFAWHRGCSDSLDFNVRRTPRSEAPA